MKKKKILFIVTHAVIFKGFFQSEIKSLSSSATTNDIPEFGWSGYAERINGRFAMIGLMAVLLVEALSKISFLEWAGIISQ